MKYQQNSLHWPEHVHDFMFRPFSSVLFSLLQPEIFSLLSVCILCLILTYLFTGMLIYFSLQFMLSVC